MPDPARNRAWWQCGRKLRWRTKGPATRQLRKMQDGGKCEGRIEVYRCPFCEGFHIGGRKGAKT